VETAEAVVLELVSVPTLDHAGVAGGNISLPEG
jgi:hypothetical protein